MAIGDDARLRGILEKVELLTGERSDGSRRAVLISELQGLSQDLSDQYAALKKSVRELAVEFAQSSASFKEEITVRADANSALAEIVTTLKAKINDNEAQIQDTKRALATKTMAMAEHVSSLSAQVGDARANITNIQTVYASDKTALASDLTRIEATAGKKRSFRQTAAPANDTTNQLVIGDLWFDTDDNNKCYYWTGSAWTDVSNIPDLTSYATTASVNDEKSARVAADIAVAQRVMTTSAGTSRVYAQSYAPSSSGRLQGDIWIDTTVPSGSTSPNLTPYVWHNSQWNDNSSGTYSQYAGNAATVTQLSNSVYDPTTGLAYQWAVVGSPGLNSKNQSALVLSGGRKFSGSGYTDYSKVVLSANDIEMNGSVIINGSITVNNDGTSPIAQNAITEGNWGNGGYLAECDVMSKKAGDSFLVIGSYIGGAASAGNILGYGGGAAGDLIFDVNYNYQFATVPIRGFMYYKGVQCNIVWNGVAFVNVCADQFYYMAAATTFMQVVTAAGSGNHHFRVFTSDIGALNQGVRIAVIRLSK